MFQDKPVLLVGTGPMAREYARVMREGLCWDFILVGRDRGKLRALSEEWGASGILELAELKAGMGRAFSFAIVAVAAEVLPEIACRVLDSGIEGVLLEKPGAMSVEAAREFDTYLESEVSAVRIAYNRRYYASVLHLKAILETEPATAAFFDFCEWTEPIVASSKSPIVKRHLGLGNSIHVFDTITFLLGAFSAITPIIRDSQVLEWHPSSATFLGTAICGETPVSWCTSWLSAGRWNIEILTRMGRYKLSPMEKLQFLPRNSVIWEEVKIDDDLDVRFKPGLMRMLTAFHQNLSGNDRFVDDCHLPSSRENMTTLTAVSTIMGYSL